MKIVNRPISIVEKNKLNKNEIEVINTYERVTKNKFMRFDIILLKRLIIIATPAQINAIIYKMYKMYPQNFVDFSYVVRPVEQMFKNRRGGKQ